jgi:hypothetical protein
LGFRVKSGWAAAVLLSGSVPFPRLVWCQPILLSDPKVPESKQPYHLALDLPEKTAAPIVRKLSKIVEGAARRSVDELIELAADENLAVRGAALVVGSVVDPASLYNDHIRAHALEGQLFRTVLADALVARSIPCEVLVENAAYTIAASALGRSPVATKRVAASLGNDHDGSWRADEKLAALGAWLSLAAHE